MNSGLHQKVTNFEDKIVSIKLLTADNRIIELIGKIVSSTDTAVWVQNPQLLQAMHVKNDKTGEMEQMVAMVNFMVTGDQSQPVELKRSLIMATALTKKEAADEYMKATSPLVTPKTPGLVL